MDGQRPIVQHDERQPIADGLRQCLLLIGESAAGQCVDDCVKGNERRQQGDSLCGQQLLFLVQNHMAEFVIDELLPVHHRGGRRVVDPFKILARYGNP